VFDLSGKVALVTGGGGGRVGTGRGLCTALAAQGAHVIVNDRDPAAAEATRAAIEAAGGQASVSVFDVTDREAVTAGVAEATAQAGPVDILVTAAGGAGLRQFADMSDDQFAADIELNLMGTVTCVHAVLGPMVERRWGRVVAIASAAGAVGIDIGVAGYGTAKAGVMGFVRLLAAEVGRFGVTANAIAPGLVLAQATTEGMGADNPVGRCGTPSDLGPLCVYLASEEAAWVTGQSIHINGGTYMG
jgi:NAD(P)-dependent dehydrogenase (short-subunit alcohol dehydrogenase family)